MSTKVISAKVSEEDYDKLLQACNEKGCTVSQFVKDACVKFRDKTTEQDSISPQKTQEDVISKLEDNITTLKHELSTANSILSSQKQKLDDLSLFSNAEISQKRFNKTLERMKFHCHK